MKKLISASFALLSLQTFAAPYKVIIISDDESMKRSQAFREYLLKKPPYSRMKAEDLEVKIVKVPKEEMKCSNSNPKSTRIITCDKEKLHAIKVKEEAHLTTAFTSTGKGGAGGDTAIASPDYPMATMLHEMLHTYGMADEYCYTDSEAEEYCGSPKGEGNSAHFRDQPPYDDDATPRILHSEEVAWMFSIDMKKLITQGTELGSKIEPFEAGKQVLGLYRGGTCEKKKVKEGEKPFQSWRPYPESIMRDFKDDTIYPIYEAAIVKAIEAKIGRTLSLKDDKPDPNCAPKTTNSNVMDLEKVIKNLQDKK